MTDEKKEVLDAVEEVIVKKKESKTTKIVKWVLLAIVLIVLFLAAGPKLLMYKSVDGSYHFSEDAAKKHSIESVATGTKVKVLNPVEVQAAREKAAMEHVMKTLNEIDRTH